MLSIRRRGKVFHARGTVRVARQIRKVNEHSTGCREREAARDYLHRLEAEIRDEILNGPAGRARRLTCAEAMHLYLDRPGGLHRMDVWRLGELGDVLGDVPVSDVLTGWARFKAKRCTGLAPATVDRFRIPSRPPSITQPANTVSRRLCYRTSSLTTSACAS
jgi:hypothetical protein